MNIQDVSDAVAREYEAARAVYDDALGQSARLIAALDEYEAARAAYDDAVAMRDAAQSRVVSALAAYNVAAIAWRNVALGSAK